MTLETLITFLTIENNNMDNYIVTFEQRVMVAAFAILAMFIPTLSAPDRHRIDDTFVQFDLMIEIPDTLCLFQPEMKQKSISNSGDRQAAEFK